MRIRGLAVMLALSTLLVGLTLFDVTTAQASSPSSIAYVQGGDRWMKAMADGEPLRITQDGQAPADACRFVLGFAALHALLPQQIGTCLDNEQDNPMNTAQPNAPFQRDGVQHTTRGLLAYRFSDNHTAFTDGYHTIVHGPCGMELRLNTQRFPWERNAQRLAVVPNAYLAALAQLPTPTLPPSCRQ